MKKYFIQKQKNHYSAKSYDNFERFLGYFNQKEVIWEMLGKNPKKTVRILEIGKGNGFLSDYLKKQGIKSVKTFDIDSKLFPDFVGDLSEIDKIVKEKFDMVVCFEVLEHINFSDLDKIFSKIAKITNKYFIFSIPQTRFYFSFWAKISKVKAWQFCFNLPFPIKHKFDGEHYWELGKKDYSRKNFSKIIEDKFSVIKSFHSVLNPYHRYFVTRIKE